MVVLAALMSVFHVVCSYASFKASIPNGGTIVHPCLPDVVWGGLGHERVRGRGARNPFGRDFEENGNVSVT